ncbi:hypothetical protein B7463_g8658, partial [Scytalidium lignicola]
MKAPKRILFFTNSDYGQANVILATVHALVHVASDVEIHIASFHELQAAVYATSQFALSHAPEGSSAKPLVFHGLNANWMVLAPNTIKDFAVPLQPGLAMLWKYPLVCSAMPFPLPWSLIPRNIFLNLVVGYALLTDTRIKNTTQLLHKEVNSSITLLTANELGVLKAPPPGLRILVANSSDIDYPFAVLLSHVTPCGPIVRATPQISSVDPTLAEWLSRGPTVYVNLGTHLKVGPVEAGEMARAFRDMLDRASVLGGAGRKPLQILWKLGRKPSTSDTKLERDVYEGPVRITDWVTAEPKSVLESGDVVCSVNHGGASSFYESICAGVPQVLLPPWSDCYDFANRVELLEVGHWANKKAKPRWEQKELAACLEEVLFSTKAEKILARAKDVAKRHPESAGREKAAREILAFWKT